MKFLKLRVVAVAAGLLVGLAHAEPTVEVLHYWTSGGEAKAMSAFKDAMNKSGGKWVDSPVAGGGGDAMNTVLRSRVLAGDPPGMTVLKGPNVTEWAVQGKLASLDDVAKAENWDAVLPQLVRDVVKYKGSYVAVPTDIHRVDWMWINPSLLAKVNGKPPTTWDEFNALADKLKAAGITPLAHGGQSWQDATMFETVVLGLGGPDFYRKTMVEHDPKALGSDTMKKVFDQMRRMRGYVDPNFAGRDWNLATAMVMNGQAAIQIMGDWAKGEFVAVNKVAGKDFICAPTPSGGAYILNADSFAFFKTQGKDKDDGRKKLAALMLSEPVQITYNLAKGSIPARLGVPKKGFDECAVRSMDDLQSSIKSNKLVPSMAHEMATSGALRGAIVDVVTEHFNSNMGSAEAVKRLVEAIQSAR